MVFKIICSGIDRRRRSARRTGMRAFTLTEYMFGMAVGLLVLLAVGSLSLYSGRSFAGLANYADLNASSMHAIDTMTRDVRQAVRLTTFATNQLVFDDGPGKDPLVFSYSAADRTLIKSQGASKELLLKDCDFLTFRVFQRTPLPGSYDQYPAASPITAKVIEVSWVCSRRILGARVNTENAQTAKIVIRKR